MKKNEDLDFTLIKLKEYFQLTELPDYQVISNDQFSDELRNKLAKYIEELLAVNFEKLTFILYRVDVSEQRSQKAFAKGLPYLIALDLADAIIERQIRKYFTQNIDS